ncbi:MAG: HD domain-containing protein [Clostridiales bacterium]|nr:HD domain-containing protein [Clostridiales bacterium]
MMKYTERLLKNRRFLQVQREIREDEAERIYCHHELEHGLDVCRISWIMYLEDQLNEKQNDCREDPDSRYHQEEENLENRQISREDIKDRLYVTGLLHDIGRSVQYRTGEHHSTAGAALAGQILREIDYPENWIRETVDFIRNHHGRQNIYTDKYSVGYYTERADQLSRNCFCCPAADTCKWKTEERNQTIRC